MEDIGIPINKENVKDLTYEELRLCRNKFVKRWKNKNKDKVNAWARDYRKKHKEIKKKNIETNLDILA